MPPTADPASDCLIIGASKAGTTSLFDTLAAHPAILASCEKEVRYFSNDERFARGAAWYAGRFTGPDTGRVRLEASPAYMTWSEKTAPRMRSHFAAARPRLVVILRDPVTRAYSHYWHRVRLGHEPLPFADAVAREEERLHQHWAELERAGDGRFGYMRASRYMSRLQPFLETFDREQFFFLLQEDLRPASFRTTMERLLEFLGVDPSVELQGRWSNGPVVTRQATVTGAWNRLKQTGASRVYRALVPRVIRQAVPALLYRPDSYPPLAPEDQQRLRAQFADEVLACQALIGRDLSHWLPS